MNLRVVGAGLPRTGTTSLRAALVQLLGGPCYHMREASERPEHADLWLAALGDAATADWVTLFDGYRAAVDWPASLFWRELAELNTDAPVVLSTRESAATWWRSMDDTVLEMARGIDRGEPRAGRDTVEWRGRNDVVIRCNRAFFADLNDAEGAMAAYERHADEVRATIPAARLVEWQAGDGWGPLVAALGVDAPEEPFPHENTTQIWEERRRAQAEAAMRDRGIG